MSSSWNLVPSDYNLCLKFLNVFGRNPVTWTTSSESSPLYEFRLRHLNASLALVAIASLTVVVTWLLFIYELVLEHPEYDQNLLGSLFYIFHFYKDKIQENLETTNDLNLKTKGAIAAITYLSWCSVAVQVLFAQTVCWAWAPKLVTFLRNWTSFQKQLHHTCKDISNAALDAIREQVVETNRRRAIVAGYVLMPTIICIGLVAQQLVVLRNNMSNFACVFQYWFNLTIVTADLLDDARAVHEVNTVVRAFNLVQHGFRALAKESLANRDTLEGIKSLTLSARSQAALLGRWLAPSQSFLIFECIILLTCSMFLVSNSTSKDAAAAYGIKIMWVTFPMMQVARLLFKASEAEKITGAEQHLAKELVVTDLTEFDLHSMYQVQCLHDLITSSPTKVTFGTYVTFDKRLLLSVLTQVVTYEIALMQFVQI